jgi:hypothetical protein
VVASLQKPKPKDIRNAFINEAEKLKKIEEAEAIKVEVWPVANYGMGGSRSFFAFSCSPPFLEAVPGEFKALLARTTHA